MTAPSLVESVDARAFATKLKRRWRKENAADAVGTLRAHPELAAHPSVVVELAYEEYLLREEAGDAPGAESFAARFPSFRAAVRSVIAAHQQLLDEPDLLSDGVGDWPAPGAAIDGVELVAVLGTGGFGRAYLAYDPGTDRPCVLKLSTGASTEARVIGRLKHPHVVEVYWAKEVDGRTAVCLSLAGVNTLAEVVVAAFPANGPAAATAAVILATADAGNAPAAVVRPKESYTVGAMAVAACVADAVAYLHAQGVTHGDIKATNVVLGRGAAPVLIDFNLSTRAAGPVSVRGTPGYLAPELLDALAADPFATATDLQRADLFALGVLTFELLTGRRPFAVPNPKDYAAQAAAARAPLPAFPDAVPPAVAAVLRACLSPDPAARPASAAALAEALTASVTAVRSPPWRWRRVAAAVAVLALAVTGAAAAVPPPPQAVVEVPGRLPVTTPEGLLARGQRHLEQEDWAGAKADFVASDQLRRNPWVLSMGAYSCAAGKMYEEAVGYGAWLTRNHAVTADVWVNHAYALAQLNRLPEALAALDRALAEEPGKPPAHYARAVVRHKLWVTAGRGAFDPVAVADVRAAAAAGFDTAEFHFDAARVFAAADPSLREAALAEVRAAVAGGKPPQLVQADATLRARFRAGAGWAPEFEAACAGARGVASGKQPRLQLVEPRPF